MLSCRIFNVGHGDSILLRYWDDDSESFGLIDCNDRQSNGAPTASFLAQSGIESLSFVALTHPHEDHYSGLANILEQYADKVQHFYSCPLAPHVSNRIPRLAKLYKKLWEGSDGSIVKERAGEFLNLLLQLTRFQKQGTWEELAGDMQQLSPTGFSNVEIYGIQPPASQKGEFFQAVRNEDVSAIWQDEKQNSLSTAFLVRYAGVEIVLGGDATYSNWMNQKRACERRRAELSATVVKLPHHGSKHECREGTIDHVFDKSGTRIALISADGQRHPHDETLAILDDRGIKPYCTSLATQCGPRIAILFDMAGVDAELKRMLAIHGDPAERSMPQACQGDITITVDEGGVTKVDTEFGALCPYRSKELFA